MIQIVFAPHLIGGKHSGELRKFMGLNGDLLAKLKAIKHMGMFLMSVGVTWIILSCRKEMRSYGICRQKRPRPACVFAQTDLGLHCPPTEWVIYSRIYKRDVIDQTAVMQADWFSAVSHAIMYRFVHCLCITKTRLFKYIENFTSKNWKFSDIKTLIFFLFLLKT